jgi:hypothetical protein
MGCSHRSGLFGQSGKRRSLVEGEEIFFEKFTAGKGAECQAKPSQARLRLGRLLRHLAATRCSLWAPLPRYSSIETLSSSSVCEGVDAQSALLIDCATRSDVCLGTVRSLPGNPRRTAAQQYKSVNVTDLRRRRTVEAS